MTHDTRERRGDTERRVKSADHKYIMDDWKPLRRRGARRQADRDAWYREGQEALARAREATDV